ncbi:MAG: HAD hydrolase family protein, partial [Pseudomonadota bacterium]|nr:HAD hydrolase family protein [Pseudomonadota bacterium]
MFADEAIQDVRRLWGACAGQAFDVLSRPAPEEAKNEAQSTIRVIRTERRPTTMTARRRRLTGKISAVVSDVDGTLVTDKKILTESTRSAVGALRERGIAFAIISSRPLRGLAGLIKSLGITAPVAGFNGGVLATPQLSLIEQHLLRSDLARRTVAILTAQSAQVWVFQGQDWLLRDPSASNVGREIQTLGFNPTVVRDFPPGFESAAKIVGVSED